MSIITYNEAISITKEFGKELSQRFGKQILAVFAIGSLGADYYRPGQSDIDTAVIADIPRSELWELKANIREIANKYCEQYSVPKGFGAVVISKEQLSPPYIKNEELILEILRLKTQSKAIYGIFDTESIPTPSKSAIIEDARAFEEWAENMRRIDPYFGISDTVSLVNSTLMILKRYLMIERDIIEFNKFKVLQLYLKNDPPIVYDELFEYIDASLYDHAPIVSTERLKELTAMHDLVYEKINKICL